MFPIRYLFFGFISFLIVSLLFSRFSEIGLSKANFSVGFSESSLSVRCIHDGNDACLPLKHLPPILANLRFDRIGWQILDTRYFLIKYTPLSFAQVATSTVSIGIPTLGIMMPPSPTPVSLPITSAIVSSSPTTSNNSQNGDSTGTIVAAWITAGIALIVALIGLYNSYITIRMSNKSSIEIESLRQSLEFANEELEKVLTALQDAIRAIQGVKDVLRKIKLSVGTSLDADELKIEIDGAYKVVEQVHRDTMAIVDEKEEKTIYTALNVALKIDKLLQSTLSFPLNPDLAHKIDTFRNDLTDLQQKLRDRRADRVIERKLLHG